MGSNIPFLALKRHIYENSKISGNIMLESYIDEMFDVIQTNSDDELIDNEDGDVYNRNDNHGKDSFQSIKITHAVIQKALYIRTDHEIKYECQNCDYKAKSETDLFAHVKSIHHPKILKCQNCDYQTTIKVNFDAHVKSIHDGKILHCQHCDYEATEPSSLQRHFESVHEILCKMKYLCANCSYTTKRRDHLKRHIKFQHLGINYSCQQCDYKGSSNWDLKRHVKSKHESVYYYQCQHCDY